MATQIAELITSFGADLSGLNKGFDDVSKKINKFSDTASGLSKPFSSFEQIAVGALRRVGEIGINAVGSAISGLVDMGKSVVATGINFDDMKQQANIAFTTMLGSGEKAKSFLDELQAFAAATPFEFPELTQAAQKMLAMGFASQDVLPTLTAIGDAVAGLGGGSEMVDRVTIALGQMQAKGKVSAEEMMQLTEAGIPAWEILADKIGVSIPEAMKLVTKGAVSSNIAVGALVDGMSAKFGGLMEAQSKTFGGLFSTIKDTFAQVSGQVMQPVFNQLTSLFQMVVDYTNKPEFTAGVKSLSAWIEKATGQVVAWATNAWPMVQSAITSTYNAIQLLITGNFTGGIFGLSANAPFIVALLGARDAAIGLYNQITPLISKTYDWLVRVLTPLGTKIGELIQWFRDYGAQIAAIVKPVGDAIAKFVGFDDVMTAIAILLAGPVITAIASTVASLATFLAPIAAVVAAVAALRWAWQNDFMGIQTFTRNTLNKLKEWFINDSGIWKGTFEKTLEYLKWWADGGWKNYIFYPIRTRLFEIVWEIQSWAKGTKVTIANWITDAKLFFVNGFNAIKDKIISWKGEAASLIEHWISVVSRDIEVWVGVVKTHFMVWKNNTIAMIKDWYNDAIGWFEKVFSWWKPGEWLQKGKDIVQGLWDGAKYIWNQFINWWNHIWGNDVPKTVSVKMETHSPSKVMERFGAFAVEGFAVGAEKALPMVHDAMNAMASIPIATGGDLASPAYAGTYGGASGASEQQLSTRRIEDLLTILIQELRAKNMNVTVNGGGGSIDYGGLVTHKAGAR